MHNMDAQQQHQMQQQYYQQQQQQQAAMMSNPYYAQQQQNHHQGSSPASPYGSSQTTQIRDNTNGNANLVGVMGYHQNNNNNAASPAAKKGINFRQGANTAGRTIINSMKNLTLNRKQQQQHPHAQQAQGTVNEWETKWDEDEDDSEGEEDESPRHQQAQQQQVDMKLPATPLHPQLRPGMDAAGVGSTPIEPPPKSHLVSNDGGAMAPSSSLTGPDGVEWDTGVPQGAPQEKPNVQMFLPLLRVLGKGSFGKVSSGSLEYLLTYDRVC